MEFGVTAIDRAPVAAPLVTMSYRLATPRFPVNQMSCQRHAASKRLPVGKRISHRLVDLTFAPTLRTSTLSGIRQAH